MNGCELWQVLFLVVRAMVCSELNNFGLVGGS